MGIIENFIKLSIVTVKKTSKSSNTIWIIKSDNYRWRKILSETVNWGIIENAAEKVDQNIIKVRNLWFY